MKYSTLIFDFGGVIINIDFNLTYRAFEHLGVPDLERQFAQHQQNDFFDNFEKGKITPHDFREAMRKLLAQNLSDQEIDKAWNSMLLDIPQYRIDLIKELKKEYRCVLLSNTNQIHYDYYRQAFEDKFGYQKFSDVFDQTFFSHEIGMRKPDADIFNYTLESLNEKQENTLFIDDTEKNILAANALGINTLLWKDTDLSNIKKALK